MSKFIPKKHFFPNQDRHDILQNIASEIGEIECADMLIVDEYKAHDLFGAVKVMTSTVTIYK